jgi:hypothetical protein
MKRYLIMAHILLLVPALLAQSVEGHASVSGRVLDYKDRPVADAKVTITPLEVGWSGPLPITQTDADGAYVINLPAVGRTRMSASKMSEGYPDTSVYAIFANDKDVKPVVDLKNNVELNNVDIHLESPDGSLDLNVVDKETGAVVQTARLSMKREDTHTFYSTDIRNGIYSTALPDKPISIEVSAEGYQTWRYAPARGQTSLEVGSLEKRTITVALIPKH